MTLLLPTSLGSHLLPQAGEKWTPLFGDCQTPKLGINTYVRIYNEENLATSERVAGAIIPRMYIEQARGALLMSRGDFFSDINVLHEITRGHPSIQIALLDGFVKTDLACFSKSRLDILPGYSNSCASQGPSIEHGTNVASILFADCSTFAGMVPHCIGQIAPIIAESGATSVVGTDQLALARAIQIAVSHGAQLINISAGGLSDASAIDPILLAAISEAVAADAVIVAAAGNDGCDCVHLPAVIDGVLAVGAHDQFGLPMAFSNFGQAYSDNGILAPGTDIRAIDIHESVITLSGTSYSTALVTGAIALIMSALKQRDISIPARTISKVLLASATPCSANNEVPCQKFLHGLIDVNETMRAFGIRPLHPNQSNDGRTLMEKPEVTASTIDTPTVGTPTAQQTQTPSPPAAVSKLSIALSDCSCGGGSSCTCGGGGNGKSCTCGGGRQAQLVYALGQLGVDFGSESRRDAFVQAMPTVPPTPPPPAPQLPGLPGNPNNPLELAPWLTGPNDFWEQGLIWTLNLDATPIYALAATGTWAAKLADRFIQIYNDIYITPGKQITMVSIPGVMLGTTKLFSGQVVPIVYPDIRGVSAWDAHSLSETYNAQTQVAGTTLQDFLDIIYFKLRNVGVSSSDRALNYSATNAWQLNYIFQQTGAQGYMLDSVDVTKSPICRPDADCWDVVFTFFQPLDRFKFPKVSYRYTIDVSDVLPIPVGPVRSWASS